MTEKVSLFRPHPWHGIDIGPEAPKIVNAYIEITPFDLMKYEVDKPSGYLKIDRPQRTSSQPPALYGFIPRTYCGDGVAKLSKTAKRGDGDPLDICVLTEKAIPHGDILLQSVPIGGLRMIDGNEADDKIIAVMLGDAMHGDWRDIGDCPSALVERLRHYFLTYKDVPGSTAARRVEITHVYDRVEAHAVIRRARLDYHAKYGDPLAR